MRGFVYIITTKRNTALYTGVTSNLKERILKYINRTYPDSFSKRYNITKLVYYECFGTMNDAIKREKQIKAGSRKRKVEMINGTNPDWVDLFETL